MQYLHCHLITTSVEYMYKHALILLILENFLIETALEIDNMCILLSIESSNWISLFIELLFPLQLFTSIGNRSFQV